MVAIIKTGSSIHNIVNYNENKIKQGVAQCIGEGNYPMDVENMTLSMRLNRLLNQASLNLNVVRNSVHISLNFHPSEQGLTKENLMEIAHSYMEKIGFGEQPYLVYQHHDSGHPHIHLVSIKIRHDGSRIDTQNIGRNQSENARKEIEESFNLIKAQGRAKNENYVLKPITMGKVRYGRIESKKAINNVIEGVLTAYKYTSLAELNAVLQQYNVLADRGSENSRIFKAKGIVYRILDENGKPVGVPIKASDFYSKPTLKFLEKKFNENQSVSTSHKTRVRALIDKALLGTKHLSLKELTGVLEKEGVNTMLRYSAEGTLYGITYVDHKTKCVFNGSTLGKQYSAKAILDRCKEDDPQKQKYGPATIVANDKIKFPQDFKEADNTEIFKTAGQNREGIMESITSDLLQSEQPSDFVPNPLRGKKRKKKRRGKSDNQ